jgi:hypothetical protein
MEIGHGINFYILSVRHMERLRVDYCMRALLNGMVKNHIYEREAICHRGSLYKLDSSLPNTFLLSDISMCIRAYVVFENCREDEKLHRDSFLHLKPKSIET